MERGAVWPGRKRDAERRRFDDRGDDGIRDAADRRQERCERAALDAGRRMGVTLHRIRYFCEMGIGMGLRAKLRDQDDQRQDQ